LGRFLSADTMVPSPGNPQALNRYSYTLNNPVKYTDPTGHYIYEGGSCAGDDCDPTASSYEGRLFRGVVGRDGQIYDYGAPTTVSTRFLSPAESKRIYGVAVAQRVSDSTLIDPTNEGLYTVLMAWGFGMGAASVPYQSGRPLAPGPNESFMNSADAVGSPDCAGCGYVAPSVQRLNPNEIGRWAEDQVGEQLPVEARQFPVVGGQRVYDGRFNGTVDSYVEIKTSTSGVVKLRPEIRSQVAFDVNMEPKPTWIFVNARPSRGLLNLLGQNHIPWHQLNVTPGYK
jgi:hypothetical protein